MGGGERYNLTRKQVRDRYNRGTFNPFARARPELRVPREFRPHELTSGDVDWREAALANVRRHLSDYFKYNDHNVVSNVYTYSSHTLQQVIDKASLKALQVMAAASEDELISIAHVQNEAEVIENLPRKLTIKDIGYKRRGEWGNVFWYH